MVHKKYTYKNGKRFGPYYYETKRVDGKVVTTYLGSELPAKNKNIVLPFIFLGVLVVLLLSLFYFSAFTGRVTLDVKSNYNLGEEITGSLNINVRAGELIPAEAKVVIFFNGQEKEFFLSDLADSDSVQGEFYAENIEISGEGEGYGLIGKREVYPEVEFELKIFDRPEESSEDAGETAADSSGKEDSSNGKEGQEIPGEPEGEGTSEELESEEEAAEEIVEEPEGTIDEEIPGEPAVEESSEEPESGTEGNAEESSESESPDAGITGAVASEGFIYGKVTKEKSFEYEVGEGKDARIVEGSIEVDGERADDNLVKLKVRDGVVEVSTKHSVEEEGFGEDFLGSERKKISIDLSEFGLLALNDSLLSVKLIYQDSVIVEAEKDISVEETEEQEIPIDNESINEPVIGVFNESVNGTVEDVVNVTSNETFANQTVLGSNITVNITQYDAVLGQPVRWKKRVDLQQGPATVSVEIPAGAENVSVRKLDEKKENKDENEHEIENNEDEAENINVIEEAREEISEANNSEITGGDRNESIIEEADEQETGVDEGNGSFSINVGITGEVTADLELEKQSRLMKFLEKMFAFTGFAVSEEINDIVVELNETQDAVEVEYYTDAPTAVEEELDRGKRIRVTGPDDVHYQNVLIYSELNESLGIRSPDRIIIYWQENDSYVPVSLVSDLNSNGIYDYIEFVAPHLSNQTFDIIVITRAEHLDSSRQFISDVYNETYAFDGVWSPVIGESEYVRAYFETNLTSERDIKIYARKTRANPTIEIYEKDGVDLIASASVLSGEYTIFSLVNLAGEQDTFDIKIVSGDVQIDHIIDPIPKFFEDCDSDISEWTVVGGGSSGWRLGTGGQSGSCVSGGNAISNMTSPALDLTGAGSANLSFTHQNGNTETGDLFAAYINSSIEGYQLLFSTSDTTLRNLVFNIGDYVTLTSGITIRYECRNNANNERCGLDNINVTSYEAPDTTPPLVTIVDPANTTYIVNSSFNFIPFNVTLNENGSVQYSLDGGVNNFSMTANATGTGFTASNSSIADGSYTLSVYANDTAGNNNYTESVTFSVTTTYGNLVVTFNNPEDNTAVEQNDTFDLNASVDCVGTGGALCGSVYALARYNASSANADTAIDTSEGATPMFISGGSSASYRPEGYVEGGGNVVNPQFAFDGEFNDTTTYASLSSLGEFDIAVSIWNFSTGGWYEWLNTPNPDSPPQLNSTIISVSNGFINASGAVIVSFSFVGNPGSNTNYTFNLTSAVTGATLFATTNSTSEFDFIATNLYDTYILTGGSGSNPQTSPTTLSQGEQWNATWSVNATGANLSLWEVDVLFNSSYGNSNVPDNDTADSTVCIGSCSGGGDTSSPEVTINFPANVTYNTTDLPLMFNVSLNENGSVQYSLDGGVNNISMTGNEGFFGTIFNASNSSIADGSYTFQVYANDTTGNRNYTENIVFSFFVENYTVNATILYANGTEINSTLVFEKLDTGEVVYNNTNYSHENIEIPVGTYNITINPLSVSAVEEVKINDADIQSHISNLIHIDEPSNVGGFNDIFVVDIPFQNFTSGTLTFIATSELLYKCQNWNFTLQECTDDTWVILMSNLTSGQLYSFPIFPGDPGYGFINITHAIHLYANYTFISDIFPEVGSLNGVWSENISDGEYVRVTFAQNLTSENDITIYPRNITGAPRVEVYEEGESILLAEFTNPVDNQYNTIYLLNLTGSQDVFDLRVVSGTIQFDHIIDPSSTYLINADASSTALGTNGDTQGKNIVRLDNDMLVAQWTDGANDASCADSVNEGVTWGTYDSLTGTHFDPAITTNGSALLYLFVDNAQQDLSYIYNTTADCNIASSGAMTDLSAGTNDNFRPDVTFDGVNNRFVACSMDNDDFDLDISRTDVGNTLSWTTTGAVGGDRTIESCSIDTNDNGDVFVATDDASTSSVVVFNSSAFTSISTVVAYGDPVIGLHESIRGTQILITAVNSTNSLVVLKSSDGLTYTNATFTSRTFDDAEGCLDANGNAHIVFKNGTSTANLEYIRYTSGGDFDNREVIVAGGQYGVPSVRCTNFPSNNRMGSDELELVYLDIINADVYFANITVDTTAPDTTAPGVTINVPKAGDNYYSTDLPINFTVSLNENGDAEYSLDGGASNTTMFTSNGGRTGTLLNYSLSTLSTGSYTFQVYANDTTGNRNYTETSDFVFNATGIDINFTFPTPSSGGYFTGEYLFVNLSTGGEGQGAHYAFTDLDNSLSLWLMMDYSNNTGGVTDLSSYSGNGTLVGNSAQNRSGKFGKAMEFDGAGDYIEVADRDSIDVDKNFTWSAWIYMREGTKDVMFSKGAAGIGAVLEISGSSLSIRERSGPTIVTGSQTLSDNTWNHVAAVYNMTDASLYVNGVLDINSTFSIIGDEESTSTLWIGKDHQDLGLSQYKGMIDEALMFSRALSSDEISYLYDAAANKYENNITRLRFAAHTFTGYVVNDVGTKNQTEQRSVTIRPEHIKIDANTDCIGLLANATTFGYGSNYTEQCRALDPSLNVCPALDADLNITITGRLNVDSDCGIFFNSTHIGEYALYLEGVMNVSNGLISTINASNTYNFSALATHASFVDSKGTIQRIDIVSPLNVSDSMIAFQTTGVKDRLVLINSTDLSSYTVSGGSVYRQFRLNVTVRDNSDNLVPGVNVSAWNVTNDRIFSQTTNGKGAVFYNLTEYADEGNGKSFWNNYTINHTKVGYRHANDTILNITHDYVLNLTLELYDTIVVNTEETLAQIFTRVGDSTVFSNLSDASRNCRYRSTAIINITSGGNLIIENCTLEMGNDLADGEFNLFVNSGGTITANFSNLTNAFNNLHYRFAAVTGSVLNIKNSYIFLTGDTEGNLRRGIAINTTNVTFFNNTVGQSYNADIEILSNNIVLNKVSFVGNKGAGVATDYNVYCRYCINVTIIGSNLSDSTGASVVVLDNQTLTLLNSNYTTHSVQPGATLYKQWYVDSFVNDTLDNALNEANVSFYNITNVLTETGLTNTTGGVRLNVSEFVVSGTAGGGDKVYQGNYTINATKAGYANEEQSWNITASLRLDFSTLTNPFPTFVLNSPENGTTEYFEGSLNITLNATVYDLYQDILEVRIYGVNETTSDFYTHGLIYKNSGVTNGTEIAYNWSSPVAMPESSTILLMHLDNLSEQGENSSYARDFGYLSNNATLTGDGRPVSGKLGGAFELDGVAYTDYLEIPHNSLYNTGNITITAWIKPYSKGANGYIISKDDDTGGGQDGFVLRFNYAQNYTEFDAGTDTFVNASTNSLVRNEWQHVAVAMNATTITFYVNGQNVGVNTGSYSIATNTNSLLIGSTRSVPNLGAAGLNGSIDDLVVYNRTLDYDEINNSYRLKRGTYLWKVNLTDNGDNGNESVKRQFTIGVGPINPGPTTPSPEINSTDGSNRTAQNLNCFDTLLHSGGEAMNVSVEWYMNSALNLTQYYNNSYTNNSFFNAVLDSGNTTKTQAWTCGIRLFDGIDYSEWVNSTGNVTIVNTPPATPGLSAPAHGSSTTDRTPTFSWSSDLTDIDGDILSFDLNITCYNTAGGPCAGSGDDNRLITLISSTSETLTSELQYFIDNNDYYNWTVRADDGEEYSPWATDYSLNITALVDVTLPNGSVEFGVVSPLGNYDTTDDSPKPFLIQNDGNVLVNVSISATDLWATQLNPSRYYQYKIANYTLENGSFNWALSRIFFRNLSTSAETAIVELNYSNATDTAEVDINISVPLDEPANVRSSTVTFTASLTE